MQTHFSYPHSLLTPEASFLGVTLPSHYQQAQRLGQNVFILSSAIATDLFHLPSLLPAFLPPVTSYYPPLKAPSFPSLYARWEEKRSSPVIEMASLAHILLDSRTGSLWSCSSPSPAPRMERDCPCLLPQLLQQLTMFLQVERPDRSPRQPCAPCVPCHAENMLWACSSTCACHFHWYVFKLKINSAILNSVSTDSCLYPNWALGSTVTLRKQREAHQHGNFFPSETRREMTTLWEQNSYL